MPLLNVRNPVAQFKETTVYQKLEKEQRLEKTWSILHLYGIPGSGKTEIVRKLAEKFPYSSCGERNSEVVVKYEIDCSDCGEDVGESLKQLLDKLLNKNLLNDGAACRYASVELDKIRTQDFVKLLAQARVPLLIIVQDPNQQDKELLQDLLASCKKCTFTLPVHVYVTSKSKEAICDCRQYEVTGFSMEEGLDMLQVSQVSPNEQNAARKLVEHLSGSPLGLDTVKKYCRSFSISYLEYLNSKPRFRHMSETRLINEEIKQKHVLEAVLRLLETKGLLHKMVVVSMFHRGNIPRILIGKIMQFLRNSHGDSPDDTNYLNRVESGSFLTQLADFAFCQVTTNDKDIVSATFHQVVFSALQIYVEKNVTTRSFQSQLKVAILAISSVVNKDLKQNYDLVFMKSMLAHIESLFKQIDEKIRNIKCDFLTRMAIAHLHEVVGVICRESEFDKAAKHLQSSIRMIWDDVVQYSGTDGTFDTFFNKTLEPVQMSAKNVADACIKAGENLQAKGEDIDEYLSLVVQVKTEDLPFLKNLCGNSNASDCLDKCHSFPNGLSAAFIKKLREESENIFLDESTHYRVFFIDRLVSTLYSWGKLISYETGEISSVKKEKYVAAADLLSTVRSESRNATSVNLFSSSLSKALQIDVRLKRLESASAKKSTSAKKEILMEMLEKLNLSEPECEQNKEDRFRNGLIRSHSGNVYHELLCLQSFVRFHTKFLSVSDRNDFQTFQDLSDTYCKELLAKASPTLNTLNRSPTFVTYCGKYFAAKGEFEKAVDCFSQALNSAVFKDDKSSTYCWICYNYARSSRASNIQNYVQDAFEKCEEVLKTEVLGICEVLREKLTTEFTKLREITQHETVTNSNN